MSPARDLDKIANRVRPVCLTGQAQVDQSFQLRAIQSLPILCIDAHDAKRAVAGADPQGHHALAATMALHGSNSDIASDERARAIDLPEVLAAHRAAADGNPRAVEVCHQLLTSEAVVAVRTTFDEVASGVDFEHEGGVRIKANHRTCKRLDRAAHPRFDRAPCRDRIPIGGVLDGE